MFKFAIPAIFIGISIALFFGFTDPIYGEISSLRKTSDSYNQALDNSKALQAERDKLTAKYNTINPDDIAKLEKLMPDSVDNIRLILEIEKIAAPYGMVLKDIKYDSSSGAGSSQPTAKSSSTTAAAPKTSYGVWNLQFSTQGTYSNFVSFLKNLESNLRIVDVSSIDFSSKDLPGLNPKLPQAYNYTVAIKTYWLKN